MKLKGKLLALILTLMLVIPAAIMAATTASLMVNPRFLAIDENGDPRVGAKLYTTATGTTTPKATWTDSTKATPNANPIVLDSNGEASVWLDSSAGAYRLRLDTSADVTLWTINGIEAINEDTITVAIAAITPASIGAATEANITTINYFVLKGGFTRPNFTLVDDDTITIGPGVYNHNGTSNQTVYWDSTLTFDVGSGGSNNLSDDLGNDEWHYVYLDDTAIITQATALLDKDCFLNDTTAPAYSVAKHGLYNGSDRCIFAFRTDGTADIKEFWHDGGDYVSKCDATNDFATANIATDWSTEVTLVIPAFARRARVTFNYDWVDTTTYAHWRTEGQTATSGHIIGTVETGKDEEAYLSTDVIASSTLKIDIKDWDVATNTMTVWTNGWYFPAGM